MAMGMRGMPMGMGGLSMGMGMGGAMRDEDSEEDEEEDDDDSSMQVSPRVPGHPAEAASEAEQEAIARAQTESMDMATEGTCVGMG